MSTAQPQCVCTRVNQPIRAWRRWAGLCLALLVIACVEGYGTDDETLVLTFGMSQEDTLRAMNHIGQQRHLDHQWHYQLRPACVLLVEAKRLLLSNKTISVPLSGKESVILKGEVADEHEVVVRTQGSPTATGTIVLEGANWMQAVQMKWLIDYAPRHCPVGQGAAG